jgi:hyperosmotically inducible protein
MLSILIRSLLLTVVLSLAACASTTENESTGEFFDSSVITAKIKNKLVDDPVTGVFRIKVVTVKGVVQLSGFVNSPDEKQRAEVIANSVDGVKKVENSLLVTPVD